MACCGSASCGDRVGPGVDCTAKRAIVRGGRQSAASPTGVEQDVRHRWGAAPYSVRAGSLERMSRRSRSESGGDPDLEFEDRGVQNGTPK